MAVVFQLGQQRGVAGLQELVQAVFSKSSTFFTSMSSMKPFVHREHGRPSAEDGQRAVLGLFEQFGHAGTAVSC